MGGIVVNPFNIDPFAWKAPVRVATAAALDANTRTGNVLDANGNGALTVDGVAMAVADRVLVKDEGTGANNGIYRVTDAGSAGTPWQLTRAPDFNSNTDVESGATVFASVGTANAGTTWQLTTANPITLNTTALTFTQFGAAGSAAWVSAGGQFLADTAVIQAGDYFYYDSRVANGATAIGHRFDTENALSTAGAKIASFQTNSVEKAYIDKDGLINSPFSQGLSIGASGSIRFGSFDSGASTANMTAGSGSISVRNNGVTGALNTDFGVEASRKLGLDWTENSFGPVVGDSYITKSATTGGNLSLFYDAAEKLRLDGTDVRFLAAEPIGLYSAIGDTEPRAELSLDSLSFGPGGVTAPTLRLRFVGTGIAQLDDGAGAGAALDFLEMTAPAGVASTARLFAEDNGAGKTRLVVIFPTGAAQVLATEP